MSETVAVLYPTRGRAAQAKERAGALLAQDVPSGYEVVLVAAVEESDAETIAAFEQLAADYPDRVTIVKRKPGTTSVYGWNQAYAYARDFADWAVLGADDVVWRDGWLQAALDAAEGHSAAFVGLHDGHDPNRKYGPHYMARVEFLEEHLGGVMAVPHYESWGFDAEASERADGAGLYASAQGTPIDHLHPVWGLAERDATYDEAWDKHEPDRALRVQRQRQGYPTDYERAEFESVVHEIEEEEEETADVDATDAARELAEEYGLDLTTFAGSGADGRILVADVQAAIRADDAAVQEEE